MTSEVWYEVHRRRLTAPDGNVDGANATAVLAETTTNMAERVKDVGSIMIDDGGDERSKILPGRDICVPDVGKVFSDNDTLAITASIAPHPASTLHVVKLR